MEWILDPTMWVGLLTLILLEVVLGIDNLVFIAILTDKLPPHQRDKARILGLSLAMIMRLGLLALLSWLVALTKPLITLGNVQFSGRDLILLFGGFFLLFKATIELHERLDGISPTEKNSKSYARFAVVVTQIVILDAVFSLDSVITAIGMVDELMLMMAAVVFAIGIMLIASKPLTRFVNAHQTVIVLCLSFLLMIGFSLVAEGFGFKIPKGYLYAAIGFSILIEFFNQLARRNYLKGQEHISFRERTAAAVLKMLFDSSKEEYEEHEASETTPKEEVLADEERKLIRGAVTLGERTIQVIMTPRVDISWINLSDDRETIKKQLLDTPHSFLLVCRDALDNLIGVARTKDLLVDLFSKGGIDEQTLNKPTVLQESWSVIQAMESLRKAKGRLIVVKDRQHKIKGVLTPLDLLEAIAGEFPDEDEHLSIQRIDKFSWLVDARVDLYVLEQELETNLFVNEPDDYISLAGYLLARFTKLPQIGDSLDEAGFRFEIKRIDERRINMVLIKQIDENNEI